MSVYPLLRKARAYLGTSKDNFPCVGTDVIGRVPAGTGVSDAIAMYAHLAPTISVGTPAACVERYQGRVAGISPTATVDKMHYLSAGTVCFARALNDTHKIAALLITGYAVTPTLGIILVAIFMGVGGLLHSAKIAETMSHRVTEMSPGQGFTANLITGILVIGASKIGVPVSTTHVSCGTLFGIGVVTRTAQWKTIVSILLAWVTTLPVAAFTGAICFQILKAFV